MAGPPGTFIGKSRRAATVTAATADGGDPSLRQVAASAHRPAIAGRNISANQRLNCLGLEISALSASPREISCLGPNQFSRPLRSRRGAAEFELVESHNPQAIFSHKEAQKIKGDEASVRGAYTRSGDFRRHPKPIFGPFCGKRIGGSSQSVVWWSGISEYRSTRVSAVTYRPVTESASSCKSCLSCPPISADLRRLAVKTALAVFGGSERQRRTTEPLRRRN